MHIQSELGQARVAGPAFERELAALLIEALNIEATVDEIDPLDPLYDGPLGLDSIDMLEIALSVSKRYGIQLRADDANNHGIFASLRSLAAHIESHRPAG
ncbi:MAG: phosphopantetheine-binding protein [Burkholderiaceae bacterium]